MPLFCSSAHLLGEFARQRDGKLVIAWRGGLTALLRVTYHRNHPYPILPGYYHNPYCGASGCRGHRIRARHGDWKSRATST